MKLVQMATADREEIRYDFVMVDDNFRHSWLDASRVEPFYNNNRDYGWAFDTSIRVLIKELE